MESIVTTQSLQLFSTVSPLRMEIGAALSSVTVAYETYGTLNAAGDNAILVCHALTGNAHAAGLASDDPRSIGWWDSFIGEGRPLDTSKYFVICSNFLGGCYGTTGPTSIDPSTGERYGMRFPQMTVRDMVRVQKELILRLGVKKLRTVIGGSLGGMQVLEWAVMFPELVDSVIPIATSTQHSPWAVGLNDLARQAIMNDPAWKNGEYRQDAPPTRGLSLARQIAMISYRSAVEFEQRFARQRRSGTEAVNHFDPSNLFQIESYLRYQGEKLVQRFDANTYLYITRTMDLHDIAHDRGTLQEVLGSITIPLLSVGIDSDILYPVSEQRRLASSVNGSVYREIESPYGHDAFLVEFQKMADIVSDFLS